MARVEVSRLINRPVAEVFDYVANHPENITEWGVGWLEMERTSEGAMRPGATFRSVGKFLGKRIEQTYEVTEYVPNESVAAKSTSGPLATQWRYTFEPQDGATRVTGVAEFEPGGLFKLANPLIEAAAKRQLETDLSNLKDLLESRA